MVEKKQRTINVYQCQSQMRGYFNRLLIGFIGFLVTAGVAGIYWLNFQFFRLQVEIVSIKLRVTDIEKNIEEVKYQKKEYDEKFQTLTNDINTLVRKYHNALLLVKKLEEEKK